MDTVVIVTRATRDHVGFRFWNGTEDVTKDLRFMMDTAQADFDELLREADEDTKEQR